MSRTFILLVGASLVSSLSFAAKVYRFTGEVTSIHKHTVTVRRGSEEAEFARPTQSVPVHIGDRITVLYGMDAQQILAAPQAAGSVPDADAPDQHVIMDDRAFFNAKNQSAPTNAGENAKNPS
jgi:hypothetical protein